MSRARAGPANPASAHAGPASRRVSLSLPLSSRCPSARRDHVPVLAAAASLRALPRGGRNDRGTHVCRLLPAQSREARLLRGPAPPPLPRLLLAGPAPAPAAVCSWGSPRGWSCASTGPCLLLGLLPTPAPASGPWTSLSLEWPSPGSARLLLPVIQDKCHWLGAALSDPQSEGTGLTGPAEHFVSRPSFAVTTSLGSTMPSCSTAYELGENEPLPTPHPVCGAPQHLRQCLVCVRCQ